jgi:hypothetical protein
MLYELRLDAILLSIHGAVINELNLQRKVTQSEPGRQCSAYCMRQNDGLQITALKPNVAKSGIARYLY